MCGLDAIFCVLSLSLSHSILHPCFWLFDRCSRSLFQSAWPPQTGVTMCGSTFQSVQPVTTPLPTPLVLVTQSQFGYRYETERNRNLMSLFTAKAQYLRLITRDIMSLTRHINPDHPKGCCPYIKCSHFTQCDKFSILNAKSRFTCVEQDFRPMRFHSGLSHTRLQLVWTLSKAEKNVFGEDMTACVCLSLDSTDCERQRKWNRMSLSDNLKAVLDICRDLDCGYAWDRLIWAARKCTSIQPHNGEPHSFYHQYSDCSGRSGGISLVLQFRAVLNFKGWVNHTAVIQVPLHGLLTASSRVK